MDLLKQYKDEETYAVIGSAMAVHRELGPGFLESAYGDALEIELSNRRIVELKTVDQILDIHRAQLIHYLKATGIKKGLLVNFKSNSLQYERFANDY